MENHHNFFGKKSYSFDSSSRRWKNSLMLKLLKCTKSLTFIVTLLFCVGISKSIKLYDLDLGDFVPFSFSIIILEFFRLFKVNKSLSISTFFREINCAVFFPSNCNNNFCCFFFSPVLLQQLQQQHQLQQRQ